MYSPVRTEAAAVELDAARRSSHVATRMETALYLHRPHAVKKGQKALAPHVLLLQDVKLSNNNP